MQSDKYTHYVYAKFLKKVAGNNVYSPVNAVFDIKNIETSTLQASKDPFEVTKNFCFEASHIIGVHCLHIT